MPRLRLPLPPAPCAHAGEAEAEQRQGCRFGTGGWYHLCLVHIQQVELPEAGARVVMRLKTPLKSGCVPNPSSNVKFGLLSNWKPWERLFPTGKLSVLRDTGEVRTRVERHREVAVPIAVVVTGRRWTAWRRCYAHRPGSRCCSPPHPRCRASGRDPPPLQDDEKTVTVLGAFTLKPNSRTSLSKVKLPWKSKSIGEACAPNRDQAQDDSQNWHEKDLADRESSN